VAKIKQSLHNKIEAHLPSNYPINKVITRDLALIPKRHVGTDGLMALVIRQQCLTKHMLLNISTNVRTFSATSNNSLDRADDFKLYRRNHSGQTCMSL